MRPTRLFPSLFALAALLLAALTPAGPARAQPAFGEADVGGPDSGKPAEFYRPTGDGPFPAMVILHGCGGMGDHERAWAQRLRGWGYAVLVIDSFSSRGFVSVCAHPTDLSGADRAADALRAAAWLRARADIKPDRVGVIGFSHGGWAVLRAVLADAPAAAHQPPFAAAVAFYPVCNTPAAPLVTDTLVLIGAADDWTQAARCEDWVHHVQTQGHAALIHVYPGAEHGFDRAGPAHLVAGHHLAYDPEADRAAEAEARAFLHARLGGS